MRLRESGIKDFLDIPTVLLLHTKESTGIGLTIVKKIVEGRGGFVTVESSVGNGGKFIFTVSKKQESIR